MSIEDFLKPVQESAFLTPARQAELTENAAWMTAAERDFLAKSIVKAGLKIAENDAALLKQLEGIEAAVQEFKKVELPKIMKEKEVGEESEAKESAENLLKKL
jgi:hypothetical protein